MKEIKLTQNQVALVDDQDYEYLSQWGWYCNWNRYTQSFYADRNKRTGLKSQHVRMHRVIMEMILGRKLNSKEHIDHINHNTLDNTRENLRIATKSQNGANRGKQMNNTSGYKGVYWHKGVGKWIAQIKVDGKIIYLGLFESKIDAAIVYNQAATEYFGEYALLNELD
jgi:hypothetical protein